MINMKRDQVPIKVEKVVTICSSNFCDKVSKRKAKSVLDYNHLNSVKD